MKDSPARVAIQQLPHAQDLPLPEAASAEAAGCDLYAAEEVVLASGKYQIVPTGVAIALPQGWEAQVRARSGLAAKHGVGLVNGIGTIDSDYRGEIKVVLINWGEKEVVIKRGERCAQLVIAQLATFVWEVCEELPISQRGAGGFGSTGS